MAVARLFEEKDCVRICAPMVRYSKLPFRLLVKKYGCDIGFTPMTVAESFNRSQASRDLDFTTVPEERPMIVQFAANSAFELAAAAQKVAKVCDGVDINCGCPQSWAMQTGYGSALIQRPELVADMVRQTRAQAGIPCSVKIRLNYDLRKTVDLMQQVEHMGVAFITIHGRTPRDRSSTPAKPHHVRTVKDCVGCPVVWNGDVFSDADVRRFHAATGVNGVMVARGLLENPALFAGYERTPRQCVLDYLDIALGLGTPFNQLHHHLAFMMYPNITRQEKQQFAQLQSTAGIIDLLQSQAERNRWTFLSSSWQYDDVFCF
eukprot:TRINITY_DN859_c1_g2_i1.p1 TRINITY_DN859_c1_g2~~TRINITY_DN859_c1_g2_i1.p1  ORF type:complete len:319 (-),score=57.35 TRINITY_DN859_c1_g2_i1:449-1405(-)